MTAQTTDLRFADLDFVYVELTVKCNLRCHFCDNEMRNLYRDMPVDRFHAIVDQLKPGTRLGLHGLGEPTLHKQLVSMVRHAKARGLYVYFNTNHTVTTDAQMAGLVEAGLDEMRISMSAGSRAGYEAYSGKDLFGALLDRTRRMVEIRGERARPLLRLVFVLTKASHPELARVVLLADELGVDELQVQTHLDWGKPPTADEPEGGLGLTVAELEALRPAVAAAARGATRVQVVLPFPESGPVADQGAEPGRCQWPFNATWITADGAVTPCCNLHDPRQINFGDAFRDRLEDIWLGSSYADFRARYRENQVDACRSCPVHYGQFKSYRYEPALREESSEGSSEGASPSESG
jgi:MoaA/NifB/PqqE/SkfB family radical SAM enzyme